MKIKDWEKMTEYLVINDFGNDWDTAKELSRHPTEDQAIKWAQTFGYYSSSIVEVNNVGKRLRKVR